MKLPRVRARTRHGRCYELVARGVLFTEAGEDWLLVHGSVIGLGGQRMGHAWAQKRTSGWVYDAVLDRLFGASAYAVKHAAIVERTFTKAEVNAMLLKVDHYGPWNDDE